MHLIGSAITGSENTRFWGTPQPVPPIGESPRNIDAANPKGSPYPGITAQRHGQPQGLPRLTVVDLTMALI